MAMHDIVDDGFRSEPSEFEQILGYCVDPTVAAALGLLDTGAILDELVALLHVTGGGLTVIVGPRSTLFASVPELASVLERYPVLPGDLQWVAVVGSQVACGAFNVVPRSRVQA